MTLEHTDTIVRRYRNGAKWRLVFQDNSLTTMAKEYGRRAAIIKEIATGQRLGEDPEFAAIVKLRYQKALDAEPRWRRDSIAALKREYHMSTDTLMKMVEQDQGVMSITKQFLTGRL